MGADRTSGDEREAIDMAEDVADFDRAVAEDDGEHITLAEHLKAPG